MKFSKDWKKDALRRDFTINAIYSDIEGNIFDPYNGKDDLDKGVINFIGNPEIRVQEDYLRILRYVRFFITYSKQRHNHEIIKSLRKNFNGISKLSKERLIDELKKILDKKILRNLSKDKFCLEILQLTFPQLRYFDVFFKLNPYAESVFIDIDFIFIVSLLIIDQTDNAEYFLYKFNFSKKNQKRIKNIYYFYKDKITSKTLSESNLNRVFYYQGKETVIDIINFKIFKSKKLDNRLIELSKSYYDKTVPTMPVKADTLMKKYKILEGKNLGNKLKMIEEVWVKNNFKISNQQVENIINN